MYVNANIYGKSVKCLIDSDAGMTVIPESCVHSLVGNGVADFVVQGKTLRVELSVHA